jgi:uncharacterized protein YndB with AHSA1/START domain
MAKENEIVITRILNAPRKLVFEAFTKPEHLIKWWGPRGFTNTFKETDIKPGGVWKFTMHGWGQDFPNKIMYKEIIKNEKISYEHTGDDNPNDDSHFNAVIIFEDAADGKTKLTMTTIFGTKAERDLVVEKFGAIEGGRQTIDKLEEHLAVMLAGEEFTLTRELNAPRELVWKMWTDPKHMVKWWGPAGFEMVKAEMDLKPGGMFHYGMKTPDGAHTMWGKLVYREIAEPERLIVVVSFCDENAKAIRHPMAPTWPLEVLSTMTFTEKNGKTTITMRGVPLNANEKEIKMYKSGYAGMQQGFAGTFAQLEEYLSKIQK